MPQTTPEFPAWQRDFALLTISVFAAFAIAMIAPSVAADGDTYWHIATGRWILEHHRVPTTDPFSFTTAGKRWIAFEWLSQVILALTYQVAGWAGLRLLIGVAAGAAAFLMANRIRIQAPRAAMGLMAASLLMLGQHVLERPHMLALPILALWTIKLMDAGARGAAPPIWLALVMVLWANLHASYALGIVLAGAFGLEAVLNARGRRPRIAAMWGGFLLLVVIAALLTPNGFEGLIYPVKVMGMHHLQSIDEWRPADFSKLAALPIVFFAGVATCFGLGVRMPAVRLVLLLLLVEMALSHIRQEIVLAVVGPLLLAEPLGRALRRIGATEAAQTTWPSRVELAVPLAVIVLLFAGVTAWRFYEGATPVDSSNTPLSALVHTPAAVRARPVFNDYGFGGWLIFNDVKPFIDGRSDLYGDDYMQRYLTINAPVPVGLTETFNRYGIIWSIVKPRSSVVSALAAQGWNTIYQDKWSVVQVAPSAVNGKSAP